MQPFQIFRAGRHTASSGTALNFTEADLEAAVAAYDPSVHEAPIVVGHPKDNGPAYGWVRALSYSDGAVVAEPQQVDPEFAEMVSAGRFKKRSASFYTPDSPSNPKPGAFYLRHVGFLGAQPPAVKGLKDVNFADADEGIVEFADSGVVAGLFRRLRDWFLAEHGTEKADAILPAFLVEDLEAEARREREAPAQPVSPTFSEDSSMMTDAEKAALKAAEDAAAAAAARITQLEADAAAATAREAAFAEREAGIKAREATIARKAIETEIDGLIAAGKVLPAERSKLVEFMCSLDDTATELQFEEGDDKPKVSPREFMRLTLAARPKLVDFTERSGATGERGLDLGNEDVADKARAFREEQRKAGKTISFTEAVAHVRAATAA